MELIGQQVNNHVFSTPTDVMVTRKAWYLLNSFGFEGYSKADLRDGSLTRMAVVEYLDSEIPLVTYGEYDEYGISMDQYPDFHGRRLTEPGWVALRLTEYNDFEEQIDKQLLAFRMESHKDGPGVYLNSDNTVEKIEDEVRLFALFGYLCMIEETLWEKSSQDKFSKVMTYPEVMLPADQVDAILSAKNEE